MKRLILVSGPSCAGKTTQISGIIEGKIASLRELLFINDPAEWTFLEEKQLHNINIHDINNLVLHFDIIEQRMPTGYNHITELFVNYENIIFINLIASPFYLLLRKQIG
jgi:uridine kinase